MNEEVKYVHHNIKDAVFNLVCLAYPYVKMKGLVDNLHKDCKDQIEVYEREHKALEIIKRKSTLDFNYIRNADNYDEYLKHFRKVIQELLKSGESVHFAVTKDEFDLLKEVMK